METLKRILDILVADPVVASRITAALGRRGGKVRLSKGFGRASAEARREADRLGSLRAAENRRVQQLESIGLRVRITADVLRHFK